jgi:hypothetical protein
MIHLSGKLQVWFLVNLFFIGSFYLKAQDATGRTSDAEMILENLNSYTSKGSWMIGGMLSMQIKSSGEINQLIRYVQEDRINDFTLKLDGAYAFRDLNFAGMGILYGESRKSGIYENSDGELYNEDFYGNSYSFRPFLKNLTPLDKNGRFNIVTQIELWYQYDQGITQTVLNENVTRKYSTGHTGLIGFRPGINVFVIRNVAVETTLNVAGVKYSFEKSEVTDMPDARRETATIDFRIDILQLNIGIFVYL